MTSAEWSRAPEPSAISALNSSATWAVASRGTPSSRAVCSAIARSLRCNSIRNPGSKRSSSMRSSVRLEDLRLREAAQQRLAHARGIDSGLRGQRQRLGDRLDREGDHDLVGGLGDLAGARRTDVGGRLAELREDRLGPLHRRLAAPGHDRELPIDRGGLPAGDRGVDRLHATLGEGRMHLARRGRRDRRHVDQQHALAHPGDDAVLPEYDGLDVRRVGEHGDHDIGALGDLAGGARRLGTLAGELLDRLRAAVVHDDGEAGANEAHRHGLAHDSEADEPDAVARHFGAA